MEIETMVGDTRFVIKKGDITKEHVDAIVNAANSSLLGGGGVDGAIHQAGGPSILAECLKIRWKKGKCPTGEAVVTTAGKLPCTFVIHAVGPVWRGGDAFDEAVRPEDELLERAYWNSLMLTFEHGITSIAFPSISTGIYRFPIERASKIALRTAARFARQYCNVKEIRFILFSNPDFEVYKEALQTALA